MNKTESAEAFNDRLMTVNFPNYSHSVCDRYYEFMRSKYERIRGKYQSKINENIVMLFRYCHC